jgi:outer membrane protein TolC
VEDNLAALRILAGESDKVGQTIQAANRALEISTAQYRSGTASYLTVITSQAILLSADVTSLTLLTRRLTASVLLIEGLGGGWNVSQLPTKQDVTASQRQPAVPPGKAVK